MAAPADRFSTAAARAEEDLLPLRLPCRVIALAPAPARRGTAGRRAAGCRPGALPVYDGGPVEFERVVPASGNMQVARQAVLARPGTAPG